MTQLSDLSITKTFKSDLHSKNHWNSYSLITRTDSSISFQNPIEIQNNYLYPVSDIPIANNLSMFLFPHPQLLISCLQNNHESTELEIKNTLFPYLLTPNFSTRNIINSIADSVSLSVQSLIQKYTENYDIITSKREWESLYPSIAFDVNQKIDKNWELKSLDNLEALHLLACSINCQIYLIFNLKSSISSSKNTVFSSIVGPKNAANVSFFLCQTPSIFINAKPMNYFKNNFINKNFNDIKKNNNNNDFDEDAKILNRVTLPLKNSAFYLKFNKILEKINKIGNNFQSVSAHFKVDPNLSKPIIKFSSSSTSSNILNIEINHPNDDYSYVEIQEKLQHMSKTFSTTEPAILEGKSLSDLPKMSKFYMSSGSNSIVVSHSVKEKSIDFNKLDCINNPSQISILAHSFHAFNFAPPTKLSRFDLYQMIRFFAPFSFSPPLFESKFENEPPIVTTHTQNFSLANAAKHPYGHFLCMHSIFNCAANSRTIHCKKCHRNRKSEERKEVIMIPVRSSNCSPFIKWICITCFDRLSNIEKSTFKMQFPMFHEIVDINIGKSQSMHSRIASLQSAADRIHMSIMSLRSQPIGALRALIPRIDAAFEELINILRLFRQRMLRLKKITANDLVTIRDSDEYKARIGNAQRVVLLPEPDFEVVDFNLFEMYLSGFFEKGTGTTEHLLTQPLSSISQNLLDEALSSMESADRAISAKIESIDIIPSQINNSIEIKNIETKGDNCDNMDNSSNNENNDNNADFNNNDFGDLLSYKIKVKCQSGIDTSPFTVNMNIYEIRFIENGNYITSDAIISIKTRKTLNSLALNKDNQILAIVNDPEEGRMELYRLPFADCTIDDFFRPELVIDDIRDCDVSFSNLNDASSTTIAVLGNTAEENPLFIITHDDEQKKWVAQCAGNFAATKVSWFLGDDSILFAANDQQYWVINFGNNNDNNEDNENNIEDDSTVVIDFPSKGEKIVKLISTISNVWAIFNTGECVPLILNDKDIKQIEEEEEEEEAELDHVLKEKEDNLMIKFNNKNIVDGCPASEKSENGILVIDDEGKLFFQKINNSTKTPILSSFSSALSSSSNSNESYNFPLGILDYKESSLSTSPTIVYSSAQVALSLAEMFPALIGYFYIKDFFLICSNYKSYRPSSDKNRFLPSAIKSYYSHILAHISLHHIEEALLQIMINSDDNNNTHKNVKVLIFFDFGLPKSASFVDSVFGTSFAFCESDGFWQSFRTINNVHYLIILFKKSDFDLEVISKAVLSAFICNLNVFFLSENEKPIFDTLSNIDSQNILSSNKNGSKLYSVSALIFLRNSKQRTFEYKTIDASLNNDSRRTLVKVIAFELYSDYSEIVINPKEAADNTKIGECFMKKWTDILNCIEPISKSSAIRSIKKAISQFSTFLEFKNIKMEQIIKQFEHVK